MQPSLPPVLLVVDLLHPIDALAVECLSYCDVGHCGAGGRAMPVLFARREPDQSPARISTFGPPSLCTHPQPDVTMRVWPSGCVCQAVRAPGSNVTNAPPIREGAVPWKRESIRTDPVKYSACPWLDGCEPLRLRSMVRLPLTVSAGAAGWCALTGIAVTNRQHNTYVGKYASARYQGAYLALDHRGLLEAACFTRPITAQPSAGSRSISLSRVIG